LFSGISAKKAIIAKIKKKREKILNNTANKPFIAIISSCKNYNIKKIEKSLFVKQ